VPGDEKAEPPPPLTPVGELVTALFVLVLVGVPVPVVVAVATVEDVP